MAGLLLHRETPIMIVEGTARAEIVQRLHENRVVVVVRTATAEQALLAGRALAEAGVRAIEITRTVPHAARVIATLVDELPTDALVGAGTILTVAQAMEALDAGARFVVSPVLALDLLPVCHARDIVCILAGLTPSELWAAQNAGADLVKLFPAGSVGGPSYVRDVLAPLPDLRLMPSGGVAPHDTAAYMAAGCHCVGLGAALLPKPLLAAGDMATLVDHVRHCLAQAEILG